MKSTRFFTLFVLGAGLYHANIFADHTVSGVIRNAETGQSIPDANIRLIGTDIGTASQDGGRFFIHNLKAGTYQVEVRVIGYAAWQSNPFSLNQDMESVIALTPTDVRIDPVLVTATLSEHLKSNVTAASDVFTAKELRRISGATAGEVLEIATGLFFRSYDGLAGNQIPSIRGSNTDQVVVLLDDIRLNTAQGGGVDLNLYPAAALDRIEVIRGGHSALLGSDALGGAIHLISNNHLGLKGYSAGVQSTMGSFGTQLTNARFARRIGKFSLFTHFSQSRSDGDFTFMPPDTRITMTRKNNDTRGSGLFIKSAWEFNLNHTMQVLYNKIHQEKGIAGSVKHNAWTGARDLTPQARGEVDQNMKALSFDDQWTSAFKTKVQLYTQLHDYHYANPEGWVPVEDTHKNQVTGVKIRGLWQAVSSLNVHAGTDLRREKLTSTRYDSDNRFIRSIYGQIEFKRTWNAVRLTLIPAIRYDDYSDVGGHTSPKLGVLLSRGSTHRFGLRGNAGGSYRVPTLNDLYWPADEYTMGNPDLKPETARNLDLGLTYSIHSDLTLTLESVFFRNHVEDLILWAENPNFIWIPQNVGKADISGIETSLHALSPCKLFTFRMAHTWTKATDETPSHENKGKRLIYRPDHKFDFWMGFENGPVRASLNHRIVSKRCTNPANTHALDGYQLLTLSLGGDIRIAGTTVNADLRIHNALDKGIYITDGYPLPGRAYRVTAGVAY